MQLSFSETCQGKVTKSRVTFTYFHNAIHTRCVQGKFGSVENHVSQSHIVDEWHAYHAERRASGTF